MGDGVICRAIVVIGELEWVHGVGGGGADGVLDKTLKDLLD